jgi:signal transduction histidine kinase
MSIRKSLLRLSYHRPVPVAAVLALSLVAALIDWSSRIELNVSIVYTLPMVLAALAGSRRLLWSLALFLVGATFAVYAVQTGPGAFSLQQPLLINRVLAAATMLLTAGLLHAWTLALDTLEEQRRSLAVQNERLDAANRELLRYQEEITRKNGELDRRRQAAEEASGRKTRLLASVSHDIRSPLNAINLMAQAIRRAADDSVSAAEIPGLARRLQSNALALADLVSDLLDIASFDSGGVELHESEFSLNELLTEECHRLFPLAQAKNLALAAESMAPPVWIRADRVKLARVLGNLVTNAIKFTQTGRVTLTAGWTAERAVLIQVRDTGVGIAPENLERIFDEFAQLRNPGRDRTKGWGLGLPICRQLVELMGGAITVESQLNRGSVFSVRLPPSCVVSRPESGRDSAGGGDHGAGAA